jgi:hypothetical protein
MAPVGMRQGIRALVRRLEPALIPALIVTSVVAFSYFFRAEVIPLYGQLVASGYAQKMTGGGQVGVNGVTLTTCPPPASTTTAPGKATFGFNASSGGGQIEYLDHDTKVNIHGVVNNFQACSPNAATFSGTYTVKKGTAGCTAGNFIASVQDNDGSGSGAGKDIFSIALSNCSSENTSARITRGNIQAHT